MEVVKDTFGSMAGVYCNGTIVEDESGKVIYERTLSDRCINICIDFANRFGKRGQSVRL